MTALLRDLFLSIVLTGRNDGYGGDFNARFIRALRFNHEQLRDAGVDHEFVLVEWAPPTDRPLLVDVAADAYPATSEGWLTTWIVDARYHQACSLNPRLAYMEFLAKNIGIRRAVGAFVLSTNADVYFGRGIIETLARRALEPGIIYRATRTDVKLGADESHIDWSLLEDPRNHVTFKTIKPPLFAGGTGDFLLLDRDSFHALRGFNEIYRLARVGIDVNFLVKAYANGYRIVDIGGPVYHTNHVGSFRISKKSIRGAEIGVRWGKDNWHSRRVIYENPEDWGLAAAPIDALGPRVKRLRFDWSAVPPLASLRRVMIPAARVGQPPPADPAED